MGNNFIDDLNIEKSKKRTSGKPPDKKVVLIIMGLAFILLIFTGVIVSISSNTNSASKQSTDEISSDTDFDVLQAKNTAKLFIDKFYNYNHLTYLEQRKECEKMMTTSFLDNYKKVFYDPEFEKLVIDSHLVVQVNYDRLLKKKISNGYQIKVTGYLKFINSTRAPYTTITQPGVWIVELITEDNEYKINDLIVL